MEIVTTTSSRPLAVESFSDSWLSNSRPNSLIESHGCETTNTTFYFDTPICFSSSRDHHHHADEIFSNGLIKPTILCSGAISTVGSPSTSYIVSSPMIEPNREIQTSCSCCCFFRRARFELREKILQWFFGRTRLCYNGKLMKKSSTKVDDIGRRTMEVKSFNNSPQMMSPSHYYDVETSIHEAVLHCKRSIGR